VELIFSQAQIYKTLSEKYGIYTIFNTRTRAYAYGRHKKRPFPLSENGRMGLRRDAAFYLKMRMPSESRNDVMLIQVLMRRREPSLNEASVTRTSSGAT